MVLVILLLAVVIIVIVSCNIFRETRCTMHMTGISLLLTSSLENQQFLVRENKSKIKTNYFEVDQIFFLEFERSKKMTWFDFFSSIGGICGLCLGMSAISIVEFFYWFTVRLGENFRD